MALKGLNINFEKKIGIKKTAIHNAVKIIKNKLRKSIKSLEINFVSDKTIFSINNKYLSHNYITDIISFDYSNESNSFDGEIFICVEAAKENSKRFRDSFDSELKRLLIHGLLHFSGYDDKTAAQRKKMKAVEDDFLKSIKKIKF